MPDFQFKKYYCFETIFFCFHNIFLVICFKNLNESFTINLNYFNINEKSILLVQENISTACNNLKKFKYIQKCFNLIA